ncbi:fimbrial protein [Escherichia coli]|uniref:fimbrial protein n=2 Tax=Escherichia TaxID=561 RepID=UPI001E430B83|nr:fimbrial protein [Escherichia coli]UHR07183.1 fimbrial protein [Escherichia coli]
MSLKGYYMKYIVIWVVGTIVALICLDVSAAPNGICTADGGTHTTRLTFPNYQIVGYQNATGEIFEKDINNNDSFMAHCHCDTRTVGQFESIYYTAAINNALLPAGVHSGINYYNLNSYLDVGISFYVLNKGYHNVPFEYVKNDPGDGAEIDYLCDRVEPLDITSGTNAKIYFYVKKPFIGKTVIPETLIARLFGTISRDTPVDYSQPMVNVYISGDITAQQTCEINSDQVIIFDFEKIPASEFSSTAGSSLRSRKITMNADIKCTGGVYSWDKINVLLNANAVGSDTSMIQTTNPDVAIKVYDKYDQEVDVHGGVMEPDFTASVFGEKEGHLLFSSAPASATGTRPQPTPFSATATLTFEFSN